MKTDIQATCQPDTEALVFYGMNHGVAEIAKKFDPYEPLAPGARDFVEQYYDIMSEMAVRAFYYLTLICTRESRHVYKNEKLYSNVADTFGVEFSSFNKQISGCGSTDAYKNLLASHMLGGLGDYVNSLRHIFYNGKFNGGYGGPAWGQVTDCLCRFVSGEFTAEMMLDTVWTLSHNNGPIFNKGMLYSKHSSELLEILDIQRSGQIPEAVLSGKYSLHTPSHLSTNMTLVKTWSNGTVGDYIDWFKVEALGSNKKYPMYKTEQLQKHGASTWSTDADKMQANKAALVKAKAIADAKFAEEKKAQFLKDNWEIMPGQYVPKFKPARAA